MKEKQDPFSDPYMMQYRLDIRKNHMPLMDYLVKNKLNFDISHISNEMFMWLIINFKSNYFHEKIPLERRKQDVIYFINQSHEES